MVDIINFKIKNNFIINYKMSKTLYNYRFFCTDNNQWKTSWSFSPGDMYSDNTQHTIDPNSITIIDQISPNIVQIQNTLNNTNGQYMLEGIHYTLPTQSNHTHIKTFPINIACYAVHCYASKSNVGDEFSSYVPFPPEHLNTDIPVGTSNFQISSSLQTLVEPGRICYLYSTANNTLENLGRIITSGSNTIITQYASSNEYISNDFINIRAYFVENMYIPCERKFTIGKSILNGVFVPANAPVYIDYKNNNSQEKDITFHIEYTF